jgi:hypothetical protein
VCSARDAPARPVYQRRCRVQPRVARHRCVGHVRADREVAEGEHGDGGHLENVDEDRDGPRADRGVDPGQAAREGREQQGERRNRVEHREREVVRAGQPRRPDRLGQRERQRQLLVGGDRRREGEEVDPGDQQSHGEDEPDPSAEELDEVGEDQHPEVDHGDRDRDRPNVDPTTDAPDGDGSGSHPFHGRGGHERLERRVNDEEGRDAHEGRERRAWTGGADRGEEVRSERHVGGGRDRWNGERCSEDRERPLETEREQDEPLDQDHDGNGRDQRWRRKDRGEPAGDRCPDLGHRDGARATRGEDRVEESLAGCGFGGRRRTVRRGRSTLLLLPAVAHGTSPITSDPHRLPTCQGWRRPRRRYPRARGPAVRGERSGTDPRA